MLYAKIKLVSRRLAYFFALLLLIALGYYAVMLRPIQELNAKICAQSVIELEVEAKKISLKPACSRADTQMGYQNALVQPQQTGKLFVLGRPSVQSFWMKNVPFELGLVYLDKDFKVLSAHTLKPHDEKAVWSKPKTAYALEINPIYLSYFTVDKQIFDKTKFH